jgi:ribosome-binding factor A
MAKAFSRSNRIAEQMRRELADLLQFEVKDPRVGMVTITEVEVTGDMAHAKVFYSAAAGTAELQAGLEKASGFLRSQIAKRMLLRTVPQLHFEYDASADYGMKMTRLIDEALSTTDTSTNPENKQN